MSNPFSIEKHGGVLRFCKEGEPVFPLFFWQTELLAEEVLAFRHAGVELYSFFRSVPHYEHPYWIAPGRYDFSRFDAAMRRFLEMTPGCFCIPRIFVSAPYWWLETHPEELCGFAVDAPRTRHDGEWQGTMHESFASELWKREMGEAFRRLIRHIVASDYAGCVAGIHIADGINGEWHLWNPPLYPDCGPAMERRYGGPVPGPADRPAGFYRCLHQATVDAIAHFCRIVKEESDFLTLVFYGYIPDLDWPLEGDHRGIAALLELDCLDMLCAPHSYARRAPGEEGYFRTFPASLALHGKFLIDEGDDRTCVNGSVANGVPFVGDGSSGKATLRESVELLRREFGNMLTHGIGMWYMDLNGGNFRHPVLTAEIARLAKWGRASLKLNGSRCSEIAVFASLEAQYSSPRASHRAQRERYRAALEALTHCGAPFDLYLSEDFERIAAADRYRLLLDLEEPGLADSLPVRLEESGVHCYLPPGDVLSANRSSVMIHAAGDGRKTVTLPEVRRVTDIVNEQELGGLRSFSRDMKRGETALYLLE